MRRFYVEPAAVSAREIEIDGALARRLTSVLRLRPGDEIVLFDGTGADRRVRLNDLSNRRVLATLIDSFAGPHEPRVRVHLYQSITKSERFEWLIEKGTELGVARIVPLIAARAVVKTAREGNRIDRWRRIAVEAAEQCGRSIVPEIGAPLPFEEAIASAPGVRIVPYEEAGRNAPSIRRAIDGARAELSVLPELSILIGPEGGYEPAEIDRAIAAGAHIVTLGQRVLRSETAGLVAATLAMQALGELG